MPSSSAVRSRLAAAAALGIEFVATQSVEVTAVQTLEGAAVLTLDVLGGHLRTGVR